MDASHGLATRCVDRAGGIPRSAAVAIGAKSRVMKFRPRQNGFGQNGCVDTFKRTPLQLFNLPQHFVIPLFQRTYVWKEIEQWEPLWHDIRRTCEHRIAEPGSQTTHFVGAIVIQSHETQSKQLTTWNVIDGQQRLTTLQLLTDAVSDLLTESQHLKLSGQLDRLTRNDDIYIEEGHSQLKVRHLNKDRAAFDEVMSFESPMEYASLEHSDSRLALAHKYFSGVVADWLGDPEREDYEPKARELTGVLLDGLQLVSIELDASENSQEIFETLNARGTPLSAADLVRNFVFQRIEAEGGNTEKAYKEVWPFESKFWTTEVSFGRTRISRSSLFINQWLVSRIGEEVSPSSTFMRFKAHVEHDISEDMATLLPLIKAQADQYQSWTEAAAKPDGSLSPTEMAVYRMKVGEVELLKPLLIWLHDPELAVHIDTVNRVIEAAESWMVRRQFLRLTSSDLGRIVASLIKNNRGTDGPELADQFISQLAGQDARSTYWPGDDEVRSALSQEAAYTRFPRARLRSYLQAIENHYRQETNQPQVERTNFHIEHVLPQRWETTWPVSTPEAAEERQVRVHRLGNLTLLTGKLNVRVSNGHWSAKRAALQDHNTLVITGRIVGRTQDIGWDEELIDQRTHELIDALLSVWPVPRGHKGEIADSRARVFSGVDVKDLISAGLLAAGDKLIATHRDYKGGEATISADGTIMVGNRTYNSPSAAAQSLRKTSTNGWVFWATANGRKLRELRSEFMKMNRQRSS